MDTPLYTDSDPGSNEPSAATSTTSLCRDQVYGELRRRLMMGEFPVRSRLVEERLASLLGVSRTPVREALVRLQTDGLVHRFEGGYFVTLPDYTGLRDLYDLRITLELRGLQRALDSPSVRHDVAILEPLRDSWRGMWDDRPDPAPEFVATDEDFHVNLSRASGNAILTDTLLSVNARIRPVRMYDFLTEQRIELTIKQHLEIVEAVLAGRMDDAVFALRRHVGESLEVVERRAAQAITRMALHQSGGTP